MRVLLALPALPALALILGCGTSTEEAGLSVSVSLAAPSSPALEGGVRTIRTDLGYEVRIERGYLATGSVGLLPCGDQHHHHLQELGSRLLELLVPKAYAHHTGGSPIELAVGAVESLLAPSDAWIALGSLAPPPDRYCGLRLTASPADGSNIGHPADGEMQGRTLRLEGTYQHDDAAEPTPFTLDAAVSFDVDLHFEAIDLGPAGDQTASLSIRKALDTWFDGIDLEADDDDAIRAAVLSNLQASLIASRR